MRLFLLTILFALLPFSGFAVEEQLVIKTDSVGQLSKLLPDSIRFSISELTIQGPVNGNDLRIVKDIAAHTTARKAEERVLISLDMSEAVLTETKGAFRTASDCFPAGLFFNSKTLQRMVLPAGMRIISKGCFAGCASLREVVFPEEVEVIDDNAFQGCGQLREDRKVNWPI